MSDDQPLIERIKNMRGELTQMLIRASWTPTAADRDAMKCLKIIEESVRNKDIGYSK